MRTRATGRWAGAGSVVVAAVAGVVILAGCGGGSAKAKTSPTTAASSTQGSSANRQALQAYRTCLQQHGVTNFRGFGGRRNGTGGTGASQGTGTPPSSRPPLSAADRAKFQAAQQACQSKLPSGFAQQRQQDLAAYRSCLKDHGVNVPATPDTNGGGPFGGGLGNINRSDPTFQAANRICAPLLPNGGFGRGQGDQNGTPASGAPNAAATRARGTV